MRTLLQMFASTGAVLLVAGFAIPAEAGKRGKHWKGPPGGHMKHFARHRSTTVVRNGGGFYWSSHVAIGASAVTTGRSTWTDDDLEVEVVHRRKRRRVACKVRLDKQGRCPEVVYRKLGQ